MLLPKRLLSMALLSLPRAASFAPRTTTAKVLVRTFAAPGITVASSEEIRAALDNDSTTVLDVRSQDEILATGYLQTRGKTGTPHQWQHMQCTPNQAALLQLSARSLLRDKLSPVLVYYRRQQDPIPNHIVFHIQFVLLVVLFQSSKLWRKVQECGRLVPKTSEAFFQMLVLLQFQQL